MTAARTLSALAVGESVVERPTAASLLANVSIPERHFGDAQPSRGRVSSDARSARVVVALGTPIDSYGMARDTSHTAIEGRVEERQSLEERFRCQAIEMWFDLSGPIWVLMPWPTGRGGVT